MIHKVKIFSSALDGQGYDYDKLEEYLAIAFVESKKTRNEVEQAISILKDRKSLHLHWLLTVTDNETVHTAMIAPKVEAVRRGRWFLDNADRILKPVKKTLRSI
jgi:hypothetical protein